MPRIPELPTIYFLSRLLQIFERTPSSTCSFHFLSFLYFFSSFSFAPFFLSSVHVFSARSHPHTAAITGLNEIITADYLLDEWDRWMQGLDCVLNDITDLTDRTLTFSRATEQNWVPPPFNGLMEIKFALTLFTWQEITPRYLRIFSEHTVWMRV